MGCPACGGVERRAISPGLFECISVMTAIDLVPRGDRLPVPVTRPCGTRYHEPVAAGRGDDCSCGQFAIGRCGRCGGSACADHSHPARGQRMCDRCIVEARDASRASRVSPPAISRDRYAALPAMGVEELAAYLAGRLADGDQYRLARVSGKALAEAVRRAGFPPQTRYLESKRRPFRGRPQPVEGWELAASGAGTHAIAAPAQRATTFLTVAGECLSFSILASEGTVIEEVSRRRPPSAEHGPEQIRRYQENLR